MKSITTNIGIHCKVSCNDQFRRFLFIGTGFSSLFAQVQHLLALNQEFVLKYKDNEGDLITLSSDEELASALNYSDGSVLRLCALPKKTEEQSSESDTTPCDTAPCDTDAMPCRRYWGGRRGGKHRGGGRCHGRYGQEGAHACGLDLIKTKLISKREYFQSLVDELDKQAEKTPEHERQKLALQNKLAHIERRLEKLETCSWEKGGKHAAKWAEKAEKRRHKFEKRMGKGEEGGWHHPHHPHHHPHHPYQHQQPHRKEVLSEEAQTQIALLKSQIDELKPGMKEVKNQIKAKKAALKATKEDGSDPQPVLKELLNLKEAKKTIRSQIQPLKEKIRELKYASC